MPKRPVTTAEMLAKLEADPDFVARRARAEEQHAARVAELRAAEAPLVDELRAAGCDVSSVWDLINTNGAYPQAIPILLAQVTGPYPHEIREGIARALGVREATEHWDRLKQLYCAEQDEHVKDGLAVALGGAATTDKIDDIAALAGDVCHGPSRLFLVHTLLVRFATNPRAMAAVKALESDPDLRPQIEETLRERERRRQRRRR